MRRQHGLAMVTSVADVRPGETVLVPSASGGVASAAVQCAEASPARACIAIGRRPDEGGARCAPWRRRRLLLPRVRRCGDAVREATAGRGVDAVVDTIGGPLFGEHMAAMRARRAAGHVRRARRRGGALDIIELFRHGHRILGFRVATPDEIRTALEMALDGRIACRSTARFALSEAARRTPTWRAPRARRQDRAGAGVSETVAYLAHCLLNANSKVGDGARCAGVYSPVVGVLREQGATIRQMPCPELAFAGTRRFWAVREQYDTRAFRAHCERLAAPVADAIRADLAAGARVVIVGIDGSPSMGVEVTASGDEWGGRPDKPNDEDYPVTPGAGLFTETLLGLLGEGTRARIVGIGQDMYDYDEQGEMAKLATVVADEG